ncbi:uncharacterized protein LOC131692082 [Topomyia yanbarensis]|uniref:uncharacterized protein LOC131692082 n=1 Tax=Topomyia yanbarensis TaxID=2498891 RepID=UPI00273C2E60|nr:uncharacterized protein LOC131692082 [Topomyia yanbarensis]
MMQREPKKKPSKNKTKISTLRKELNELRSEWMRLEGERIQMAVRQTDLMSHWSSISATYMASIRERDETIQQLLASSSSSNSIDLSNEEQIRAIAIRRADRAVQTELW